MTASSVGDNLRYRSSLAHFISQKLTRCHRLYRSVQTSQACSEVVVEAGATVVRRREEATAVVEASDAVVVDMDHQAVTHPEEEGKCSLV
jgi:hypothetical protein